MRVKCYEAASAAFVCMNVYLRLTANGRLMHEQSNTMTSHSRMDPANWIISLHLCPESQGERFGAFMFFFLNAKKKNLFRESRRSVKFRSINKVWFNQLDCFLLFFCILYFLPIHHLDREQRFIYILISFDVISANMLASQWFLHHKWSYQD